MDNRRINWIDMAKGYGIIAVFIGHMVQNSLLGLFVYSFHLPLFFFLSGYLFNPNDRFGAFIKKKCRGILLPYFTLGLVVVLCDALYPLLFSGRPFTFRQFLFCFEQDIPPFLIQNRYATLWYLAVLFGVNIAMYLICRIKNMIIQAITVCLAFAGGMLYYTRGGAGIFWNIDVILPALIFFWAGYFTREKKIIDSHLAVAKSKPTLMFLFLIINIIFNVLTLVISGEGLEMYRCSYGIPPFTLLSAFAGIFFVIMLSLITSAAPITYIGKNSLIYFMWHQAVIYPVLDVIYSMAGIDGYGSNVGSFLAIVFSRLLITCLIMWVITEILKRTPLRIFTR